MKDEIKAILEFLDDNLWVKYGNTYQKSLTDKECKLLLDHINNLQEENEKLKSYIKLTDEEAKEYMHDTNKEIDRLNNIINELEKDIRNNMADYDKLYEEQDEQEYLDKYFALKIELDKLKELKEGRGK